METKVRSLGIAIEAFVALAFANNNKMMRYVNTVYNKDKEYFYSCAVDHPHYKSSLVQYNRITKKMNMIKALGVLIGSYNDENLKSKTIAAAEKAFPEYARLMKKNVCPNLKDIVLAAKKVENNDQLYAITGIYFYFIGMYDLIPDLSDDFSIKLLKQLIDKEHSIVSNREKYWNNLKSNDPNIDYNKIASECFKRVGGKTIAGVCSSINKQSESDRFILGLADVALQSEIPISMYDLESFSSNELKNAIKAYLTAYGFENIPDEKSIDKFFCASLYIKSIARMYHEIENIVDKNNSSIRESEGYKKLQSENMTLLKKIDSLNSSISRKQDIINEQQLSEDRNRKKIYSLEEELSEEKEKNKILIKLLENNETPSLKTDENMSAYIDRGRNAKAVLFGGPSKWQSEVSNTAPNYLCISVSNNAFDVKNIDNAEIIIIKTDYLSHAQYKKIIERVRKKNKKIVYCTNNIKHMFYDVGKFLFSQ